MSANREYKSSVFARLFDSADKLLSLYNAVSGGSLPADTPVQIATLEDVLFMERRNDIAFILDGKLVVLVEHQSTICENMPLRLLFYAVRVYEKVIDNEAVYLKRLLKIPRPDFIVLYNGTEPYPDEGVLRLSTAYREWPEGAAGLGGSLELTVRVVNVNEGRNEAIVKKCGELHGYSVFVGKVRKNEKAGMNLTAAVTKAVKDCIDEGILSEFLKEHGTEVASMFNTEWNFERALAVREREGREEGIGLSAKIVNALMKNVPIEEIAEKEHVTVDEVKYVQSLFGDVLGSRA